MVDDLPSEQSKINVKPKNSGRIASNLLGSGSRMGVGGSRMGMGGGSRMGGMLSGSMMQMLDSQMSMNSNGITLDQETIKKLLDRKIQQI